MAVALDSGPFRRRAAVVECWLANQLDLNAAFKAENGSHQQVVSVLVGRRPGMRSDPVLMIAGPDRQSIADDNPTGRRLPSRDQDVGTWLVDPLRRMVNSEWPEPKAS